MFDFIKEKLKKIYSEITDKLSSIFGKKKIDNETIEELKKILLSADIGVKTTNYIIELINEDYKNNKITDGSDLKNKLKEYLEIIINTGSNFEYDKKIYILLGVNGSGKTTFSGKLANFFKEKNKKVLLVAADTFRAAAKEQLESWAKNSNCDIFIGKENQDPASVVFEASKKYKSENYDYLIIDTAGRLQTKDHLMREINKIKKVLEKTFLESEISTILSVDSILGQNSFQQAKIFHEIVKINGIVLTKLDGTGKGGIVFSIIKEFGIPVAYISFGESIKDIKIFNATEYINNLLGINLYK